MVLVLSENNVNYGILFTISRHGYVFKVKAFFLDRDGVINIDHGYLSSPEQFDFNPGVFEACKIIKEAGFAIFIVTNQSGIARGYFSEGEYQTLNKWMLSQFSQQGITIDAVYYCPHHATHGTGDYLQDCDCRKPKPGMLLKAKQEFGVDMAASVMIGDKLSDVEAGHNAGISKCYLIDSQPHLQTGTTCYDVAGSLLDAVRKAIQN